MGIRQLPDPFDPAVGQGNRYGCDDDFRDTDMPCDSDLACGGGRQIDDATLDVGTAILDPDDGALPGCDVGDLGHGSERESAARRVIAARVHRSAIRHTFTVELARVIRGVSVPLSCREIWLRWPCNSPWRISTRGLRGPKRRERDSPSRKEHQRYCSGQALHFLSR